MFRSTSIVNDTDAEPRNQLEYYRLKLLKKLYQVSESLCRQENEMYGEDVFQGMDVESNPRITHMEFYYRDALKINTLIAGVKALYDEISLVRAGKKPAVSLEYPDAAQIETTIRDANETLREIRAGDIFQEIRKIYLAGIAEAANLKNTINQPLQRRL